MAFLLAEQALEEVEEEDGETRRDRQRSNPRQDDVADYA
jgi:hypothetical protein